MFDGNGSPTIAHSEKNLPNSNRQDSFLLLAVLLCSWYVVTNLYSPGCSALYGRTACIILSTNAIYSSLLSLVKVGALTTQKKE